MLTDEIIATKSDTMQKTYSYEEASEATLVYFKGDQL